jgi:transposase
VSQAIEARKVSREFRTLCQDNFIRVLLVCIRRNARKYATKSIYMKTFFHDRALTSYEELDIFIMTLMSQHAPPSPDPKKKALRASGALHPHPQAVHDEAFLHGEFFDPNDIVQVKYEMLRRHRMDLTPVAEVARAFGTSRQAFYTAGVLFDSQGIPGLIPKRRGPRGAHKCTDEILNFAEQWKAEHLAERTQSVAEAIEQHFGVTINPRSIDRALTRRKKKRPSSSEEMPS